MGATERSTAFMKACGQFLHTLEESTRAQFRWSVNCDYRDELLSYKRITDEGSEPNSWAAITRNERFNRYWQAMQSAQLRREKLVLFLSKRICTNPPASADKRLFADHYRRVLHQFNEAFDQHRRVIASLFEPHGCRVSAMSMEDLFRYFATFLNPSYLKRDNYDPIRQFKPEETIHQNCWHQACRPGGISGSSLTDTSQSCHSQTPPAAHAARPFLGADSLPFLDYSITVNLYPLNVRKEIDRTEKSLERVRGDYRAEGKHSLLTAREVKEQHIRQLAQGDAVPFNTISSSTSGTRAGMD
jgi:hypothetical protein